MILLKFKSCNREERKVIQKEQKVIQKERKVTLKSEAPWESKVTAFLKVFKVFKSFNLTY